jgi:3D (Asp-Asp-Asp) domain-containing protein
MVMRVSAIFPPQSDDLSEDEGRSTIASDMARRPIPVLARLSPARYWARLGARLPAKVRSGPTMRQYAFLAVFAVTACATASTPPIRRPVLEAPALSLEERAATFQLTAPRPEVLGPDLKLWATHYHKPVFSPAPRSAEDAIPLLGRDGTPISAPLRREDWCAAALQGSLSIKGPKGETAYAFIDDNGAEQTNCDDKLGNLSDGVKRATRRARFRVVAHAQGCGSRHIPLLPFRTIAVDTDIIPLESVIFVPDLRGKTFTYDGKLYVHDGYLFAGDRGGAIHGKHIDIFTDDGKDEPFPGVISSTASKTFTAHIVDADAVATGALRAAHAGVCAGQEP